MCSIFQLQEICGYEVVAQFANDPDFLRSAINLRGMIVPFVDLRIKFKLGKVEAAASQKIKRNSQRSLKKVKVKARDKDDSPKYAKAIGYDHEWQEF